MKLSRLKENSTAFNALVVNDHLAVRRGLKTIIDRFPSIIYCDVAENGKVAIDKMKQTSFDLILLDLNMPVMDGTTTYFNIRKHFPNSKVIIVSMYNEKRQIIELYQSGIDGYLLIETEENEYHDAIVAVTQGGKYFTPKVKTHIDDFLLMNDNGRKKFINTLLTHREIQVISCICNEMSAKQIAENLSISESTVNNHRSHIMKKLGVDSSVGLVVEALKLGVVKL